MSVIYNRVALLGLGLLGLGGAARAVDRGLLGTAPPASLPPQLPPASSMWPSPWPWAQFRLPASAWPCAGEFTGPIEAPAPRQRCKPDDF